MPNEWNLIGQLTDKNVLGTDGMSIKKSVKKARGIVINADGKYAVMFEKKSNLYTLPGGGIESGEDENDAIIREIFEETGCTCDVIKPLGVVMENRFHMDSTRLTYFYVIKTKSQNTKVSLTDEEIALETICMWCTFEEMNRLIRDFVPDINQKKFIQARDLLALDKYIQNYGVED